MEYVSRWNTELAYLLFLITSILVIALLQVSNADKEVVFSYTGHGLEINVTMFHILAGLLFINALILIWAQYRRERLEKEIRRILGIQ